jgi:predicted small secreted protein
MKFTQKKPFGFLILLIMLVVGIGLVLTGCLNDDSGYGSDFNPVGTWTGTMHESGTWEWVGQYTLTVRANGTFTMIETYREVNQSGSINTYTVNGTYSVSGANIWFRVFDDGESRELLGVMVDNNTITLAGDGGSLVLRRS